METHNLAKGLYHIQNAIHYFEHIKSQPNIRYEAKHFFNLQLNRLNGVITDLTAKLSPESAMALRKELESDTMVFEAINDKLVNMNQEQRWEVENFIDSLLTTSLKNQ